MPHTCFDQVVKNADHTRYYLLACAALFLYASGLLSIGIANDWRLRHEDNGAVYSTLALTHLHLGLTETRAHDFFYNPQTGEKIAYGHHPPGLGLALAAAFNMVGSEAPWVARTVPILCHLGSLLFLVQWLRLLRGRWQALLGGVLLATLPQSAYFGRMVGYEPLGLFCVMMQLSAYTVYRLHTRWWALGCLALGVLLGGLVDWAPLYFSLGLCAVEFIGWLRGNRSAYAWTVLAVAGLSIVVFDVVHMAYAYGSLERLVEATWRNPRVAQQAVRSPVQFILTQLEVHRRFFTHAGLVCVLVTLGALVWPRWRLISVPSELERDVLGVCFGAALAYLVSIAGYAMSHQYSQFYLLPAVVLSMVRGWGALGQLRQRQPRRLLTALSVLFVLDVVATSAVTLRYRHTHPEAYALRTTAAMRAQYLLPPYPGSLGR